MSDQGKAGTEEQKQPSVFGITEQQYAFWVNNDPIAIMLMRYLNDYHADLVAGVMERWQAGGLQLSGEHEIRGFCNAIKEITTLRLPAIATFYEQIEVMRQEKERAEKEALPK